MLEELKRSWQRQTAEENEIQRRIWDRAAKDYGELPIPSLEDDPFLREMGRALPLSSNLRILDIGCGSGIYSMALAPKVQEAVGVDISPAMIQAAEQRSQALGLTNTDFQCINWREADIDALGFRGAFDIVFAHMTPAICGYDTFQKMCACSRNLCMLEKPTRRTNKIMDEAFRLVGIQRDAQQYQGEVPQIFTYLWYHDCCPRLFYRNETWTPRKTTEDMIAWCTDRALLEKELSPEERTLIRDYVTAQAQEGMVQEYTTTTRVTMIWTVV